MVIKLNTFLMSVLFWMLFVDDCPLVSSNRLFNLLPCGEKYQSILAPDSATALPKTLFYTQMSSI